MSSQLSSARQITLQAASDCIRCGQCLPACPTFQLLGTEADSPRGRLGLMRAVAEGRLERTDGYRLHLDRCLGCRACEAVCPAGVEYGRLLEIARADLAAHQPPSGLAALARRAGLRWLLPHPSRIARFARMLRVVQRLGLPRLAETGAIQRIAPRLARAARVLPRIADRPFRSPRAIPSPELEQSPSLHNSEQSPAHAAAGEARPRAYLFQGCVMPHLFPEAHRTTWSLLERAGFEVATAAGERCCGALHAHAGDEVFARALAMQNIATFPSGGVIIVNSAGCGAMLKEYGKLLADDPEWSDRARAFAARVRDITELLAGSEALWPKDTGSAASRPATAKRPLRVAYQHPCHLAHAQRVRSQPIALLRALPGVELVELDGSDRCCGSAGIYNLLQPELADRLLSEKIEQVAALDVDVIVSANPGCLGQLRSGVETAGLRARVCHITELLAEQLGNDLPASVSGRDA